MPRFPHLPFIPNSEDDAIPLSGVRRFEWVESVAQEPGEDAADFLGVAIAQKKISLFFLFVVVIFLLFFYRTISLQLVHGSSFALRADRNKIRTQQLPSRRGILYDRFHTPLLWNIPNFTIQITSADLPKDSNERKDTIERLAALLGKKQEEITAHIGDNPYHPTIVAENIPYDDALKLDVAVVDMPGVALVLSQRRQYNQELGSSIAHVLGYTGRITEDELRDHEQSYDRNDSIGKTGLEYVYERDLRGSPGKKQIEVDALGHEKRIVAQDESVDGKNIITTLDSELQKKTEEVLASWMKTMRKKQGIVIVSDPRDGGILAIVSLPGFDNNLFAGGISQKDYQTLVNDPSHPLLDRAVYGEYPSGSTIKPIVAAAALQEHVITAATTVLSIGGIHVGEWFFPDWKSGGHGVTTVTKALAESVNTFFYAVSGGGYGNLKGLGAVKLIEYYKKFGLGERTGIDLPSERSGFVPSPAWKEEVKKESWYIGDTYHIAIGQGDILVTPLQVNTYTAYFANGGKNFRPHLFRETEGTQRALNYETPTSGTSLSSTDVLFAAKKVPSGEFRNSAQPEMRKDGGSILKKDIVDKEYIATVREGLRQTVVAGSARRLNSLPIPVAGKTGTAQWQTGKPAHAWFTGWAPYENPEVVITVLVEEGEEGSTIATPIAYDILKWYFTDHKK